MRSMSSSFQAAIATLNAYLGVSAARPQSDGRSKLADRVARFSLLLKFIQALELEEPLSRLNVIHVAGTKGKGSTCAFTEHILRSCGYRTGLFTSPHLLDIRERFRFNGNLVSEEIFAKHFWWCWNRLQDMKIESYQFPFFFPFLTFLALRMFTEENVDVAIIEVGVGGRYDATNVIQNPTVCGITSLGFDHMATLGNTLGEIAYHKAGILKAGVPAFTAPQDAEAMAILQQEAKLLNVPLSVAPPLETYHSDTIKLGLNGEHQRVNSALAVALCATFEKKKQSSSHLTVLEKGQLPKEYLHGLEITSWPGRGQVIDYEVFSEGSTIFDRKSGIITYYLDGAHTAESMEACAHWFSSSTTPGEQVDKNRDGDLSNGHEHATAREISKSNLGDFQKVLLFNCMPKRDPSALLKSFIRKCKQNGIYINAALFVPPFSNNLLIDTRSVADIYASAMKAEPDLSWQIGLQQTWESLQTECYEESMISPCMRILQLRKDVEQGKLGIEFKGCIVGCSSAVMPSLPTALSWLRCWALQNPVNLQVLATGSLYLVSDVLKLLENYTDIEMTQRQ